MDGFVGSVEAAGAAKYPYIHKCNASHGENNFHGGESFPTVENHFPPWKIISHRVAIHKRSSLKPPTDKLTPNSSMAS